MEESSEDEQLARALALSLEGVNPGNLIMQHDNQTNQVRSWSLMLQGIGYGSIQSVRRVALYMHH